ncbi:MAG: V-type ATP synthase subunit E [Eubacterium sp.]|nr:V-type ATP synthase subunit E [Eubacterium sp.]
MSGLDNIVKKIKSNSRDEIELIKKDAESYRANVLAEAKKDTDKEIKKILDQAKRDQDLYEEKVVSNGEFKQRNALLKAKGEVIDEVIDRALDELKNQDADSYFATILNVLKDNTQDKDGKICFSKKDLDRIPSDFEAKASDIAKEKGGSLTVDNEPADIDDGFILKYGDIEENCTFDAIFEAKRDDLRDLVNKNLFNK